MMELTISEETRLAELEAVIKDGMMTFIDVGASLLEIRNSRLYRHEYSTFEQYCREKWSMGRSRVYQLIDAHKVITNLSTIVDTQTTVENVHPGGQLPTVFKNVHPGSQRPNTERQARPLAKLKPEEQKEAWQQAVDTAPEGKVTAKHVEKVVAEMKQETRGDAALSFLPPAMRKLQ